MIESNFFLFPSDDEKNLNRQEELFVEDPHIAHLFDVKKNRKMVLNGQQMVP